MDTIKQLILLERYLVLIKKMAKYERIYGMEPGDLISELWIALIEGISHFEGRNGASELTFVKRILENKIIDLGRQSHTMKRTIPTFSRLMWVENDLGAGY